MLCISILYFKQLSSNSSVIIQQLYSSKIKSCLIVLSYLLNSVNNLNIALLIPDNPSSTTYLMS